MRRPSRGAGNDIFMIYLCGLQVEVAFGLTAIVRSFGNSHTNPGDIPWATSHDRRPTQRQPLLTDKYVYTIYKEW